MIVQSHGVAGAGWKWIVPLAGGSRCYFFEPVSQRTLNLAVRSDEFIEALAGRR